MFVGLQVHPPKEVAPDYEDVVGAILDKRAAMLDAISERNQTLGLLAGSVRAAEELGTLVRRSQTGAPADPCELDKAFAAAGGEIFSTLRQAGSNAYEKATIAKATGERFQSQVEAYRAAPEIYKRELRLSTLEEISPSSGSMWLSLTAGFARYYHRPCREQEPQHYDFTAVEQK